MPKPKRVELDGTRQQFKVNNVKPMIRNGLGEIEMTEEQILDAVEHGKTGPKRIALRTLCSDGSLERLGSRKKGNPYRYRKACSPVPALSGNNGNENLAEQTPQAEKMLVPNTSFLYRSEETRIYDDKEVRLNPSEMLVPEKSKLPLIRDDGDEHFATLRHII
jgi:hypothetical protein